VGRVYVIDAKVVKSQDRFFIYPSRKDRDKVMKLHGRKVKVIVIEEDTDATGETR